MLWAVITHERNHATLHEIEEYWSIDDLWDAWRALDIVDAMTKEAYEQARDDR
jgi:hypothetical protein